MNLWINLNCESECTTVYLPVSSDTKLFCFVNHVCNAAATFYSTKYSQYFKSKSFVAKKPQPPTALPISKFGDRLRKCWASLIKARSGIDPGFRERSLTKRFARVLSFLGSKKLLIPAVCVQDGDIHVVSVELIFISFAAKFWYRKYQSKLVSMSSQRSLKIAANEHTSSTVVILLIYESALGSKELKNDRERSWRRRD